MPAFIVFMRTRTRDEAEMALYRHTAQSSFSGRVFKKHASFGAHEVLEGANVEGVAIVEFPSLADARAWYESPAYQSAAKHRHLGADYNVVIVEGLNP